MSEIWAAAVAGIAVNVATNALTEDPEAPTPRSLGGELGGINNAYGDTLNNWLNGSNATSNDSLNNLGLLSGGQFDAGRFFNEHPDIYKTWLDERAAGGLGGWTPEQFAKANVDEGLIPADSIERYKSGGIPALASQLNTQSRTANLQDVKNLGQDYVDITRGANQDYYNALNSFTTATQQTPANTITAQQGSPLLAQLNQRAMNAGPSALQTQQNDLASSLLALGGNLSASDLRNVQQSSRAGFAARGLDATNASVVDETAQTDAARRARLLQNLGVAQSVQNQGLAEQNLQNQFGLGVSGQNFNYGQLDLQGQALAEQQRQAQLNAQGQAVQLQRGGFLDPYAAIIGSADQNLLGQLLGQNANNQQAQTSLYNGLLGYGGDLNNTNYNANAAANIAGSNQRQAMYGSLIQAGGGVANAYLSNRGTGSSGGSGSGAGYNEALF